MTCNEMLPPNPSSSDKEEKDAGCFCISSRRFLLDSSSDRKSDAQSKHGHYAVEGAVLPTEHAACCRGHKGTNQSAGWTCDVIDYFRRTWWRSGGGGGHTVAVAVPEVCAAHLDAGAILLCDGAAHCE